jgi:hypothetical protein
MCPSFVSTKLSFRAIIENDMKTSIDSPSPLDFVKYAIDTIGTQPFTNGYPIHNLFVIKKKNIFDDKIILKLFCFY